MTDVHESGSKRHSARKRVLMEATLFTPDGALKVRIRDLSSAGAHVIAEIRMLANCDAILKKGKIFAAARVVWSQDKEAGLKFYKELMPDELGQMFHPVVLCAR